MGEIFLSYSRRDQDFADTLTRGLAGHRIAVWVDREDIQAGEAWRASIAHAIAECAAFLVILSPQCVASKNVVKELSIAESRGRHIIPVMYQKCDIPEQMEYQLAGLQWIDFSEMPFEGALDRLVSTLRHEPAAPPQHTPPQQPAPPPAPPPQWGSQFPSAAAGPAPQPAFAAQELAGILCGRWNIRIGAAYGAVGQLLLDMYPNGAFAGQLMTPMGASAINGAWQIAPTGQLVMNGQQTMGWMASPYVTMVQFTQVTPNMLAGVTGAGEQVAWTKVVS